MTFEQYWPLIVLAIALAITVPFGIWLYRLDARSTAAPVRRPAQPSPMPVRGFARSRASSHTARASSTNQDDLAGAMLHPLNPLSPFSPFHPSHSYGDGHDHGSSGGSSDSSSSYSDSGSSSGGSDSGSSGGGDGGGGGGW